MGSPKSLHPLYKTWTKMRERCHAESASDYKRYGARGIAVCERWRSSFENFLADMGDRPDGMTLDRIDNDGPYAPENCRWATLKEQSLNRRQTVIYTLNGETMSQGDWAKRLGVTTRTLKERRLLGWPVEKILAPNPSRLARQVHRQKVQAVYPESVCLKYEDEYFVVLKDRQKDYLPSESGFLGWAKNAPIAWKIAARNINRGGNDLD